MKKNKKFLLISLALCFCLFVLSGCSQVNLTGVNSTATPGAAGPNGTPPEGMTPPDGATPPADGGTPPADMPSSGAGPAN